MGMLNRLIIFILAMIFPFYADGAPLKAKLIVTVSLSKNSVTIQKNTKKSKSYLTAWIIPIAKGSIKPGIYKLERMTDRYKSQGGNVILENVVRTDGHFNLRTTRMFKEWRESGRPAVHTIVMDAETGSLLFTTINRLGLENTILRVIQ